MGAGRCGSVVQAATLINEIQAHVPIKKYTYITVIIFVRILLSLGTHSNKNMYIIVIIFVRILLSLCTRSNKYI